MDRTNTFDLEDLNDDFWERVVYFELQHSSGLGGPSCVWFVTEDKQEYYLGFEDLPFSEYKIGDHFPFLKKTGKYENGRPIYEIEKTGWHCLSGGMDALVRDDIWQALQKELSDKEDAMGKSRYGFLHIPDIVGQVLGTEKLERVDYIRSAIWQENYDREMKKMEGERERNKLTTEHFDWKPLYPNNEQSSWQQWGWYALLFAEKEGRIHGTKFSIVFQWKETSPMCCSSEVERYNLFVKSYDDVVGPLHHPSCAKVSLEEYREQLPRDRKHKMPSNIAASTYYEWTTLGKHEVNDYGSFRRSLQSLEEAKELCVMRC